MAERPQGEQPEPARVKRPPASAPWAPPPCTAAQTMAAKAVASGTANPEQQKRFIEWLVRDVCRYADISYRPGEDGRRDTDFAEGKRFVAAMVVKEIEINLRKPGGEHG